MDHTKKHIRHVRGASICTGVGGLDRGLENAFARMGISFQPVIYVEREAYPAGVLVNAMEKMEMGAAPILPDVHGLAAVADLYRGNVEILTAGFPCQPFSVAGLRRATNDPRHLWSPIFRFACATGTPVLFFENVPGIITAKTAQKGVPVLLHVLRDLEKAGYIPAWGIYSAGSVGAPHQRDRVFILAYADNIRSERAKTVRGRWNESLCSDFRGWPAGKGQQQKDWEPSRLLLADTNGCQDKLPGPGKDRRAAGSSRQTGGVPGLGGSPDGLSGGVDSGGRVKRGPNWERRMITLGNAVVPQTAEMAFIDLSQKLGLVWN